MQGFMRQRGTSWELRAYLGRDAVTGKKRWATRTVRGGKREAQRALSAMVAEADRGTLARTDATVGELLERWFDQAKEDFSPKTVVETRGFRTATWCRRWDRCRWASSSPTPLIVTTGRCGLATATAEGH